MDSKTWWGRHSTQMERVDYWQIGPLRLWAHPLPYRMCLTWVHQGDWLNPHVRTMPGEQTDPPPLSSTTVTCAYGHGAKDDLVFAPMLPDRAMIVRLNSELNVLPGEEVNLFILTPLFLRIQQAEPVKSLYEIPIYRPSDTWFGPMDSTGSLSYASPSRAYLDLKEVPLRPHSAITTVTIRNLGGTSLHLDRLNVPSTRLSLFYSNTTGFWTDRLTLERRDDDEMAHLRLDKQPPPEANPTQFISGPRSPDEDTMPAIRAFSRIFSQSTKETTT